MAIDGDIHFDAAKPGLYTVIGKDRPVRISVNLLDRRISAVNRSALAPAVPESSERNASDELPLGLSVLLLLIAAALLCVEWVAYHRRITL